MNINILRDRIREMRSERQMTPLQRAYLEMHNVARKVQGKAPLSPGSIIDLPPFERRSFAFHAPSALIGFGLGLLVMLAVVAGMVSR